MLSPRIEEIVLAHNREEKGKRRVEEPESSNFKMFSLLIEIKEEMKRR